MGASAALTGLLFVAVSINLSKILSIAQLSGRAAESLIVLASVLVTSTLRASLVPAAVLSFSAGIINSWVLLIEIQR